jgi:hypothetical protein
VEREARLCREQAQAGLLQPRVVIVVHIVDPEHGMAVAQEALGDVEADEAGGSGDEDHAMG